jgi:adenosylhomocysteine nucleosidase
MDASPLFARHEVPLYGRARFATDAALSDALAAATQAVLARPEDAPCRGGASSRCMAPRCARA